MKAAILFLLFSLSALADLAAGLRAAKNGDYATALKEFLPLAKNGDPVAQANLGSMYLHGQGVTRDDREAAKWLRMAAEQGDEYSQYSLGIMYHDGQGVPLDYKEALRWSRMAAEQGASP